MKRACDACRQRKVKCDGTRPCTHCKLAALSCTYLAVPQRKGRQGEKANVISALRAAQSNNAAHPVQRDLSGLERAGAFARKPGLLSSETVVGCTEFFFTRLHSTLPILNRQKFQQDVILMNDSIESYCLVVSFCAFVIIQTGGVKHAFSGADGSQLDADISHGRTLLDEALAARRQLDILAEPMFETVIVSFFLYCCHVGLGLQREGWFFLREATTLYSTRTVKSDDTSEEAMYLESLWQNLYWLLLVSERSHAIRRYRPITLQITSETLPLNENSSEVRAGFRYLVELFRPFDETFMALWNKADALCLPPSLVALEQRVLAAVPASAVDLSDDQTANLRVSQQWLRTMIWRLSTSLGFLSSSSINECMTFRYPLLIARDLTLSTFKLPQQSMEVHGIGLTEKVYDVACTVTDVLSCIPSIEAKTSCFELGPEDYLNYFFSLIYKLRGGKSRFLPLLLRIVNQTLPSMISPITRHLQIPSPGISQDGVLAMELRFGYDETMFGFHDTEMNLWLERGRISTDIRDRVEQRDMRADIHST
ncbi:hypothetical protein V1517DRAFT_86893 [Lipomyces orientalis]|uniref:Uncharacterized protein n=1 Tax=Lipomyces orientalis TaxID=1233043 RepID=A0ACC3TS02_9ASCO